MGGENSSAPSTMSRKQKSLLLRTWKEEPQNETTESLGAAIRSFAVQHQLGLSLNCIILVAMTYALFPALREKIAAFFFLSYPQSVPGDGMDVMYGQGPRDLALVASFIVCFTAIRAFMLEHLLMPLGGMLGIRKQKVRVR